MDLHSIQGGLNMPIATPSPQGSVYVNPEMQKAYQEAIQAVQRERVEPAHIREARRQALLRWLEKA